MVDVEHWVEANLRTGLVTIHTRPGGLLVRREVCFRPTAENKRATAVSARTIFDN
jgi:hypothetical protein